MRLLLVVATGLVVLTGCQSNTAQLDQLDATVTRIEQQLDADGAASG